MVVRILEGNYYVLSEYHKYVLFLPQKWWVPLIKFMVGPTIHEKVVISK